MDMLPESAEASVHDPASRRNTYKLLLGLGVLLLFLGLMAHAGSLMSNRLSGEQLDSPFNVLFYALLLYLMPATMIAISLSKLRASFRLSTAGVIAITLFGFLIGLVGQVMKTHNYFVTREERTTQAFNNVEIMYAKRFNLIRNLDASSKNYQAHEQRVLADIAEARRVAMSALREEEKIVSFGKFDASIREMVVNIEKYPTLKADKFVFELMKEITTTESALLASKVEFNNRVSEYNASIRLMPYALTARLFDFQPRQFIDKESSAEIYDARKLLVPSN